jgi:hypothetical protein
MLPIDLQHFRVGEFRHPDLVDPEAARFLDDVRDRYGSPVYITDDARMPEDHPAGGSPSSLHYAGRAFDLKWIQPATQLARFVESVIVVAGERGCDYELELVNSLKDRHVHLGLQRPGHPSELIVASD